MADQQAPGFDTCQTACSPQCNCGNTTQCASAIEQEMRDHHQLQLHLCDQLESIADGLPDDSDTQNMLEIARRIYPTVKSAHDFEEKRVFPFLESRTPYSSTLKQSLERLQFEHWEDESFAEELREGLMNFVKGVQAKSPDTLAYMLRGFFEGIRRHIAFEAEHILPMLKVPHSPA